ncbi:hypothetical protein ACIQXW_23370 [Lysinibacillus sp. NPDC097162]|uniref:hypothetical protein n=1 Tax=Lysinibacillus sp. NPDC097162 TaxID=3364140 RepID=UPI00381D99BD
MSLNIEISDKYRIKSDDYQIIVQRKHTVDPTLSPAFDPKKHSAEKRIEWRDWKWCAKPEQALEIIARQRIFESDAQTLGELRNEIALFKREISGLLHTMD